MALLVGKKKKHKQDLAFKNAITGYLFILPFIIGFLAFMVSPLLESLRMSVSTVNIGLGTGSFSMVWNGINNYKNAFLVDAEFRQMLVSELEGMAFEVPAIIIFSFFIAIVLNQNFKGRGFVRTIFFLPVILSSGVLVGLEYNNTLLQGMEDVIKESTSATSITVTLEEILSTSGMGSAFFETVFQIVNRVYDVAVASGIQIIIFISGLQTVPASMYEAAKIEGCTAWESFWKITFPMVSSLILVNIIYTIVDFFVRTDNEVMNKITEETLNLKYGDASAMAWVYFACIMVIIGVISAIVSKLVYYYE